jgi:hypothetical protein
MTSKTTKKLTLAYNTDKKMKFLCLATVSQVFALAFVMMMFHIGNNPTMAGAVMFGSLAITTFGLVAAGHVTSLLSMCSWHRSLFITLGIFSAILVLSAIDYLLRLILGILIFSNPLAGFTGLLAHTVFHSLLDIPILSIVWFTLGILALIAAKQISRSRA